MNKRAIFVTGTDYKDHNAPYLFRKDIWEEVNNEDFIAYPSCNTKSTSSHMVSSKFFRILTEVIWLAWFETPSKPFLGEQVVPNMFKCAHVNFISVDLLTPTIAESFIWSWQKNEPTIKTPKNGCTIIDKTTGRWYIDTSCNTLHIHACKSINNEKWTLSTEPSVFSNPKCPNDFKFDYPRNSAQNQQLLEIIRSIQHNATVWINYQIMKQI
jgi:hypothetical protein